MHVAPNKDSSILWKDIYTYTTALEPQTGLPGAFGILSPENSTQQRIVIRGSFAALKEVQGCSGRCRYWLRSGE
jgi:hypothetical protein